VGPIRTPVGPVGPVAPPPVNANDAVSPKTPYEAVGAYSTVSARDELSVLNGKNFSIYINRSYYHLCMGHVDVARCVFVFMKQPHF